MSVEKDNSSVKVKLLSSNDKVQFVNEMNSPKTEADLRLHDAVYYSENTKEIVQLLKDSPELVFEKDDDGRTPLHTVAIAGHDESVHVTKLLLGVEESNAGQVLKINRKGILDLEDAKGWTALHYAAYNALPELTEALIKYGSHPGSKDLQGNTPLHYAVEVNTERAISCCKLILKLDSDGSLINSKNGDGFTPLHFAVKKEAVELVRNLLQKDYKLDISNTVNAASGQTILHYLCTETGETERSVQIFETILSGSSVPQFNLADKDGRTPLHIAAIRRLPRITALLNREETMNILKTDRRKRTALHYAAENGCYPSGFQCVEVLIGRKFRNVDSNKLVSYLYQMRDDLENTAFMYAVLNCPNTTVQKYLKTIPEPKFWLTEIEMTLLYKQNPRAVTALMNNAFTEQDVLKESDDARDVIMVDFGSITGYVDPVEKLPQQETKYLKNALWWDFETQKEILMHPLVQLYVSKKCQKLKCMIYGWILWQLIWLVAYTGMVYAVYTKDVDSKLVTYLSTFIIVLYILISILNEVFESISVGLAYIFSWSNAFQLAQIVFALFAVYPVVTGTEPTIVTRNCAAIGILLAHILSMRDFGKLHEKIGFVIEILKQVVFEILKVLCCCFMLVLGFTHAFKVIFEDEESLKTSFPGPLVKVMVMMTGEFEYNDTFKKESDGHDHAENTTRLVLFLLFLICVPVAFFNLLTGFALDRVLELRERAKVGRIVKHLEHIYFIETILLSFGLLKKFLPTKLITNWIRRHNITTERIEGDLRFEVLLKETTRKVIDRRTAKERKLDIYQCLKRAFGSDVDPSVRNEIFSLANANSAEIRESREKLKESGR